MPPRKKKPEKASIRDAVKPRAAAAKSAPKPKAKKKAGPWKMPPPLPSGLTLTDSTKKQWVLGSSVGKGGFGEIYMASKQGEKSNQQYVIKIEPHENGPLFTEISFYTRTAREDKIDGWIKTNRLDYLPVPKFIALGSHDHQGTKYRFLVMKRFGEDIEKKFTAAGRKFKMETVCYLALRLLEAVEFLHESDYVHADIKGSNLLTGLSPGTHHEVYLVDYGLAYRFNPEGKHKPYEEDPRRAHDGTIEFTSIDAHKGVNPSRRADLEILGYCLLQWACGRLPWEGNLEDKDYVAKQKISYRSNVKKLMQDCFKSASIPSCLESYMNAVYKLGYEEKPNYKRLKDLFTKQLGSKVDCSRTLEWLGAARKRKHTDESPGSSPEKKPRRSPVKRPLEVTDEESPSGSPPKKPRKAPTKRPAKASAAKKKNSPIQKKSPISRRKKGGGSGSRQDDEESVDSEVPIIPKVKYPKELGYQNEDDTAEEDLEEEIEQSKGRRRKKKVAAVIELSDSDDNDDTFQPGPSKKKKRSTKR